MWLPEQCDVGGWIGIVQVASGTAGEILYGGSEAHGTVVAAGPKNSAQCNVGGWSDIVQARGMVMFTRWALKPTAPWSLWALIIGGQCNVGGWTNIVQVSAGPTFTVGSNFTLSHKVVAVGDNYAGQCDVGGWRGIDQTAAGGCVHGGA